MNSYLSINELIEELGNGLWTFCLRLTENRIEAEDLYQDTILKALELKDRQTMIIILEHLFTP